MFLPDWLVAVTMISAALIIIAISVGSALKMSLREAISQRAALVAAIATLMVIVAAEHFFNIRGIPVIGFGINLAGFAAGCLIVYSIIVGMTLLFRPRYRAIGIQLVIVSSLELWWSSLAEYVMN